MRRPENRQLKSFKTGPDRRISCAKVIVRSMKNIFTNIIGSYRSEIEKNIKPKYIN